MKDNAIARAVGKTLSQPEKTLRLTVNGQEQKVVVAPRYAPSVRASRRIATQRPQVRMWAGTVRSLHGAPGWETYPIVRDAGRERRSAQGHHARRPCGHVQRQSCRRVVEASPRTAGLDRRTGPAMWKLPEWLDHVLGPLARHGSQTDREPDSRGAERAQMPLWISGGHTSCRPARRPNDGGGVR